MRRPPRTPGPAGISRTAGHSDVDVTGDAWESGPRVEAPPHPRGVHVAPYRVGGCTVFFAVDRRGERVAESLVAPDAPPHQWADGDTTSADRYAVVNLWCYLDSVDPEPKVAPAPRFTVAAGGNRPARGRKRARPTLRVERGAAAPRRLARRGGDA